MEVSEVPMLFASDWYLSHCSPLPFSFSFSPFPTFPAAVDGPDEGGIAEDASPPDAEDDEEGGVGWFVELTSDADTSEGAGECDLLFILLAVEVVLVDARNRSDNESLLM